MSFDRSMRNALAAVLLVAALFVAMNQVVASAPFADWWLPILLFVLGAALALSPQMRRAQPDQGEEAAATTSPTHTYELAASQAPQLPTEAADANADAPEVIPFTETAPEAESSGADNLTRINGIGRKSADALKAAGIDTFRKLASSSDDALRAAITDAGVRLVGDVDTWAQQAAYAARGDWDELKQFNAERKSASGD